MNPRRVLLVEDDPSLQQFVEMALEDMQLELRICASVAEALQALTDAPVDLIITDLMLPDACGETLLEYLQAKYPLHGRQPRVVVFSGGLRPEVRSRLLALGAWRLLDKPCPLAELEDCVREGLGSAQGLPLPAVVNSHFGGNVALYQSFRANCLKQFAQDIQAGDAACAKRDNQALRRLAHSLKSVLLTLGHASEASQAQALEQLADNGHWARALPAWQALSRALSGLR